MPGEIAKTVNRKVAVLYLHTAGGRIKFRTDSTTLAVKATMHNRSIFSHQPAIGTAGFDVYEKDDELGEIFVSTFKPPLTITDGLTVRHHLEKGKCASLLSIFRCTRG